MLASRAARFGAADFSDRQRRPAGVQPRIRCYSGPLPADGAAGAGSHRPDGVVHVGHAGNVTASTACGTYDIYQTHIRRARPTGITCAGSRATVFGNLASVAAAYSPRGSTTSRTCCNGVLVRERPLFATFLLGCSGAAPRHGAFYGLLTGTITAALHYGLTLPRGAVPGIKGGFLVRAARYPSEMALNF